MKDVPIRIMQFEFDAGELVQSIPGMSFGLGLSMTLPYLEPYLIRSMREALKQTDDAAITEEVKIFIGQEAQHFRQHRVLNDVLRSCHGAYSGLQAIEDDMEADYQRFSKTKSLKFNLAYAEGFEAATCALARTTLKHQDIDADTSDLVKLFTWHLTEEIEHRTVAFNIYDHLYGSYFYRLFVGLYAQYHFFGYVLRFKKFIKANRPQPPSTPAGKTGMADPTGAAFLLSLAGAWLSTYLPWYNPAKIVLPKTIAILSARYSEEALETRGVG